MRNPVIDFLFIRIRFCVRLADTFRNNFLETFLMTCVLAIFALHTGSVFEKLSTKCAAHDAVELLQYELVSILFLNFFFTLTDCTFTIQPCVEMGFATVLFDYNRLAEKRYIKAILRAHQSLM